MANRPLLLLVPFLALKMWVGDRVPIGAMCPVLVSPAAATAPAANVQDVVREPACPTADGEQAGAFCPRIDRTSCAPANAVPY